MTSTTFFIIFIPILAILLLAINLLLAPHNPYQEKDSAFECGFSSFLGQNRTEFSVSFFIFGLLFLLFDLEILLVYPYSVSSYTNDLYGLVIMMVFFVLLTLGFIFELGKNALTIDSRQTLLHDEQDLSTPHAYISSVSTILYTMGINLENFAYKMPSARKMYTGRTKQEVAEYGNSLSQQLTALRDNTIAQANQELQAANVSQADITELSSYIDGANQSYLYGMQVLTENMHLVMAMF